MQLLLRLLLFSIWLGTANINAAAATKLPQEGLIGVLTPQERAWVSSSAADVRVAPEGNYPPFSFAQSGVWQGISADYLQLIEAHLGVHFQRLPPQSLDTILKQARNDQADLITSLKSTPERDEFLAFTSPYIRVPTVIVSRIGNTLGRWPEAFAGKKVAVGNGYVINVCITLTGCTLLTQFLSSEHRRLAVSLGALSQRLK